jgi:heme/copper-type cytochrome/quinol oxidase subunit 3
LQIKEFQIMGLSINDSVYSCVFFFLTGLHFFHLLFGLLLLILLFWSCSFSFQIFSSWKRFTFRSIIFVC